MARFDAFSPDFEHPFINSSPDYSTSRNGSYKSRPIGEMTAPIANLSWRERSLRLRNIESERAQLVEELIYQLELSEKLLEQTRLDHTRETHYNREVQLRENNLQDQLRQVKTLMDRDPFILVLIDGDGTVFTNELLQKGERGGKEAAKNLWNAANEFAAESLPHLTSPKVVARIYVNAKGVADTLVKTGCIDKATLFEDFMRGFNSSKLLFDFVDAGTQKDRVIDKTAEIFKLHLYDCHCHQIVLGCSHNDEYAHLLEEVMQDPHIVDHVTLLEGVPLEPDLARLQPHFKTAQFDSLFRHAKLVAPQPKGPLHTIAANLPALTKVESNATTASSTSTPAMTWASMTAAPFVPMTAKPITPAKTPTPPGIKTTPGISRNRLGQRVDKFDPTIPREEIQRIKKLKLCNVFFLQGSDACTNTSCSHDHNYPLTRGERKVLGEVARMTPCYYQMDCDDPECIYGHRCPQSKPGEKECWYKEDCRFWGWGHGIDTRVVKTTRV